MFSPKVTVKKLQQKSQNALDVFTKTKNELKSINEEITQATIDRVSELDRIKQEIEELENASKANFKVIEKITEFLAD